MKLKRVVRDGEVIFLDATTGKEVKREKDKMHPNFGGSSGLATLLNILGIINLFGGLISGVAFIDKDSMLGAKLLFSSIIISILFFVVAKVLNNQNELINRINKLELASKKVDE